MCIRIALAAHKWKFGIFNEVLCSAHKCQLVLVLLDCSSPATIPPNYKCIRCGAYTKHLAKNFFALKLNRTSTEGLQE